jgi:pimeloyl-ACP methyl ester carboxylesterase/SAM-dependent methyltransferase
VSIFVATVASGERMMRVNGVELCVETFGEPDHPAILLIGGAASPMDWWADEFCRRLAAGLRFVIRYDSRDTGRSVSYPAGAPGYTELDLAADAVGVLDALGVRTAHLAGISMGGALAQRIALDHPDRVASLALLSTSPAGPGAPGLPPMSDELLAHFSSAALPDGSDRAAVVAHIVATERRLAAPEHFDEARVRATAERVADRTSDLDASLANHMLIEPGDPIRPRLGELRAPTLVIHGTADRLFPYGHAEALAREIPDATLLPLPGVGHQVPPPAVWDEVIPALLRHTSGGWEEQGQRLVSRSYAGGDPTGWFDPLYAAASAGEVPMPWDRTEPNPLLVEWAQARAPAGGGRRAIVVGCGLGADAEYAARLGYDTVAFDIAENAVRLARRRNPGTGVRYLVADLLDPPAEWLRAFDLVVEVITVQALPDPPRRTAIVNVGRLVAPGGTLVVVALRKAGAEAKVDGPPFPLAREEIEAFATDGLRPVRIEETFHPPNPARPRWRAEFHRPA